MKKNPRKKLSFNSALITKPCPFCGDTKQQLQEYMYRSGMVVRCQTCWAITNVKFTWLAAVDAWENEEFSEETIMLADNGSIDLNGAFLLAEAILEDAGKEYKWYLSRSKTAKSEKEKSKWKHEADQMEKAFFKGNSIIKALPIDGDAVVRTLKEQVEKEEQR